MTRETAGLWKYVATSAVTACAFLAYQQIVDGREYITRSEFSQIAGEYPKERELILHQLKTSGEQITALNSLMQDSIRQQAELRGEVQTLVSLLNREAASK